jgi:hypothetical protein
MLLVTDHIAATLHVTNPLGTKDAASSLLGQIQ